jgi:glycosyltransferase involved in cell wall biosynthesis
MECKKMLIVAYHFPPDAAVGSLRPQKFVKYLPEFGWQPYVLTIKEKFIRQCDVSRLDDVKHAHIFRTSFFRTPLQFLLDAKCRLMGRKRCDDDEVLPDIQGEAQEKKVTLSKNILKILLEYGYFPDNTIFWALTAVVKGTYVIKKFRIPFVYTTSPPHSVDIIGYLLSKLTGAKLILDHRDPWAMCKNIEADERVVKLHHYFEMLAFRQASCILTTTDKYSDALIELCPELKHKVHTIFNGYDQEDLSGQRVAISPESFVLTYVGNFYLDRSPVALIKAVAEIVRSNPEIGDRIRLQFVGSQRVIQGLSLDRLIVEEGIAENVRFIEKVTNKEAIGLMLNSNVLLLFAPNQYYQVPGKTFEYMACHRPILALTEDGATADLIRKYNAGTIVPQNDVEKISHGIYDLYQKFRNGYRYYEGVDISAFERKQLTGQLVGILEGIS